MATHRPPLPLASRTARACGVRKKPGSCRDSGLSALNLQVRCSVHHHHESVFSLCVLYYSVGKYVLCFISSLCLDSFLVGAGGFVS